MQVILELELFSLKLMIVEDAYARRVLTKSERCYCVTRRELLAVVTFVKQFRPYFLNKYFTLHTDHGSLTWLCNFKEPEGQLARWLEQLQEYDYTIVHRSGRKHRNADALSRMPCKQCGRVTLEETEQEILIIGLQTSTEQLRDSQLANPIIGPVLQAVEKKDRPSPDASRSESSKMRRLFQQWDQLKIKEGTLWRLFESEDDTSHHLQLIVPTSLREEFCRNYILVSLELTLDKRRPWHGYVSVSTGLANGGM